MTKEKFCRESRVIQTHRVFPFDLNPFGALFGGKLMSLIDDAASISVSRHCRRGAVTASLDNLNFLKHLKNNKFASPIYSFLRKLLYNNNG